MKIGLIQQHNTSDVADNRQRLGEKIQQLAHEGAELIVLQELHNGLYFCQTEDVNVFDQAEPIPGPSTRSSMAIWPNNWASSSSPRCSNAAPRGCTTTPPW